MRRWSTINDDLHSSFLAFLKTLSWSVCCRSIQIWYGRAAEMVAGGLQEKTKYGKDAGTFDTNNKDEDQALQCWIYLICDIYFTYVTEKDADNRYEGC